MYKYIKESTANTYGKPYKNRTFAFMLSDILEKEGLTERALAKKINTSHTVVNKLATGNLRNLSLENALKICIELNCTLDDLLPIVKVSEQEKK